MNEPKPMGLVRRSLQPIYGFVAAFVGFVFIVGLFWDFLFPLLYGFATTSQRIIETPPFSWKDLIPFALGIAAFCYGLHIAVRWLMSHLLPHSPWRRSHSCAAGALIFLLFTAGICLVGITHQTTWLVTDPNGVYYRTSGFRTFERVQKQLADPGPDPESDPR